MKKTIQNRIHIIGSIGSGKTTLAKSLSDQFNIPHYELDNIVWKRFDTGDVKRTEDERNNYLNSVVSSNNWIIEGAHHKWIDPCFQKADYILFLNTSLTVRRIRIVKRFLKQKVGLEKSNYKPTLKILKDLYSYNTVFEHKSKSEIFDMLRPYEEKVVIFNNAEEARNFFNNRDG